MVEPTVSRAGLTTISLLCPLWGQVAEVTALCGPRGLIGVVHCPLSQPGRACATPCEDQVRSWCEYAA